ncbi:MAG: energy transducer TonB, partial [Pseudomonas sp.]|uniref:energy transducer TonB n=1 Tax=Pseudomonas sp. TaxID=306 RepID=UPI003BB5241C
PVLAKAAAPVVAAPAAAKQEVLSLKPAFHAPPAPPRYPAQARRRNQQGVVMIEVRLDERGEQRELKLLRSSGVDSLDQAALDAVAVWRFQAEVRDGQSVPSRVQIPIQFALTANR